jgi:drug/metabolite transporter (DMT)-like permease
MTAAGVVWLIGAVCTWVICIASNHGATDHKFSGVEIIWNGLVWPLAALVWVVLSFLNWRDRRTS